MWLIIPGVVGTNSRSVALNTRFNGKSKRATLLAVEDERSLLIKYSEYDYVQCKRICEMFVSNTLVIH